MTTRARANLEKTDIGKGPSGLRAKALCRVLAAIGITALVGGCYQHTKPVAEYNPYPVDYRQRHPITLKEGEQTVEIFIGRDRGGLTPDQRADVLAFAQAWRHEAESGIVVDVPRGAPTARAARDSLREVNSILVASGVPRHAIFVRNYQLAPTALPSIKMIYSKLTAIAGPCGQWPVDLGPTIKSDDFENRPYWNLGCATQRNLASMVADPTDLVQPRGEAPADAGRRSTAIAKYRQGQSPSSAYDGFDAGKISGIGK